MRDVVAKILEKEIKIPLERIKELIEIPPTQEMGDFAFPCFSLAKELKKSPLIIADEISKKLIREENKEIQSIEKNGSYVNFFVNKEILTKKVLEESNKKNWGELKLSNKKEYYEYSCPNTHKAFHVGHIRGTSLGESLSRISENCGNKIIRGNYSGDTGMHIAKWIWCYLNFHKKEKLKNDESWIAKIYVDAVKRLEEDEKLQEEVNRINQKIEKKDDKEINEIWKESRKLSIESWKRIYKELNTHFDIQIFESEIEITGKEISLELVKKGIAKKDDGATIVDLKDYGLAVWVLLRSDDTVLYSAKDLALARKKFKEFPADNYLVLVGNEQTLHFEQLKKTLELMNEKGYEKYNYMPFGMVRFPEGKMSSRSGKNILYSDFVKEVKDIALKKIEERSTESNKEEFEKRALIVGVAAIKYSMLKQDPKKTIIFDPKADVSFEGDTGPYLLYSYARASSIIRKAKPNKNLKILDLKNQEISLIKKIHNFPETVKKSYDQMSPNILANYSYELSKTFNEFYHSCPVIGGTSEGLRLALVDSFRKTLKKSLYLLGIDVLEEM